MLNIAVTVNLYSAEYSYCVRLVIGYTLSHWGQQTGSILALNH